MRKLIVLLLVIAALALSMSVVSASEPVLERYRAITNGGGNTFTVRMADDYSCVFTASGADVGGTERYTSVNAFLDRAADLYTNANGINDELKSHGNITGVPSGNAFAYNNGIAGFGGQGVGGNYRYQIGDKNIDGKYWLNNNWGGTRQQRAQNFETFLEVFIPYFADGACEPNLEAILDQYCSNDIDTSRDNWGNASNFVEQNNQWRQGTYLKLSGEGVPGQCFIPAGFEADYVWSVLPKNQ